ncbi:MAG: Hsp20/alpha crystallin family protein [Dehalococcoidia bacterium]|nr:MAG: Hsp20/alpha crystallin family protein [Dehalococcoidia bacterium]
MAEKSTVPVKRGDGSMARWEPFAMLERLQEEMERFFGQGFPWPIAPLPRRPAPTQFVWAPRMDIFEQDGNLVIKADLPGLKKDDIEVTLDQGDLVIRGERKEEKEVKEENYYRSERSYGSFYRRLALPFDAKPEQVQAEYKDGVLEIRIPKPAESVPPPQKIAIK